MSQLFAFNNAETIRPSETPVNYDPERQVWVGENASSANTYVQPDGPTCDNWTGTLSFPDGIDATCNLDWR